MVDAANVIKSDQEQAVAAWVGYLNQVRIDRMLAEFAEQDLDLEAAVSAMGKAMSEIEHIVVTNRGGMRGIHGFIAEAAEVGIQNARSLVKGEVSTYEWVDDNGIADMLRSGQELQMKFSNAGGTFSLSAVRQHLEAYPDFLSQGGKYVIPRDHYDTLMHLHEMPEAEASRLVSNRDGLSYSKWKKAQDLFSDGKIQPGDLEPAATEYADVQLGTIEKTMEGETESLRQEHNARHDTSYEKSKPTLQEGAKVTAAAAAIEGGAAFAMSVAAKIKGGKRLRDFDSDDWVDIAGDSGKGFMRGGVRGASVYFLTNHTATSGAVASSLVTASFGVAEQAHRMREGSIDETEFIERSELLCLDATVSAVSSFVGQAAIPIPVLGAVVGNTLGNVLYQIAKDGLNEQEQLLIRAYTEAQNSLDELLDARYQAVIVALNIGMREYLSLLDRALSPSPVIAFEGSMDLARSMGIPDEELLTTLEEVDDFFLL